MESIDGSLETFFENIYYKLLLGFIEEGNNVDWLIDKLEYIHLDFQVFRISHNNVTAVKLTLKIHITLAFM